MFVNSQWTFIFWTLPICFCAFVEKSGFTSAISGPLHDDSNWRKPSLWVAHKWNLSCSWFHFDTEAFLDDFDIKKKMYVDFLVSSTYMKNKIVSGFLVSGGLARKKLCTEGHLLDFRYPFNPFLCIVLVLWLLLANGLVDQTREWKTTNGVVKVWRCDV